MRVRSEGALDAVEVALTRVENVLRAPDWLAHLRAQTEVPQRIDDAVDQVLRVDLAIGTELGVRRNKVAELARDRLRKLGVESTATKLDDLLVQLVARARVADATPDRSALPTMKLAFGATVAAALLGLIFGWGIEPTILIVIATVLFIAAIFREP